MHKQRVIELTLLLLAIAITSATAAIAALDDQSEIGWIALPYIAGLALLWFASHLALRRRMPTANGLLLPVAALLQGLGFAFVLRIDSGATTKHLIWSTVATGAFLSVVIGVRSLKVVRRAGKLLGIPGAIAVLLPPIFHTSNSYFIPSGFRIQSVYVDLQKIGIFCLIIFFADWLASYRLRNTAEHFGEVDRIEGDPSRFAPLIGGWLIASFLLIFNFDTGSAFIVCSVFLAMWWVAVGRAVDLLGYLIAVALSTLVAVTTVPEMHTRFQTWLNPGANPEWGDSITRSSFALAGGGLTGTGPGGGSGNWVPDAVDNLIFVPLAEELGFIGGTAILSTFVLLLGVGFRLANGASNEFDSIVTIGMTIFLASQTWSSIAVALQLLPPAGHSLPFISLNGAALVVGYTGLALLLKISEGIPFVPDKTQLLPQIRLSNRSPS